MRGLEKLESVPILGVHMWFDRPVMREPAVALIEGPLQWLFRKDAEGGQVHGVISAARAWVSVPKDEALKQFEEQVRSLFAAAKEAKLLRGVIVIEKRATFSPLPGTDALRPGRHRRREEWRIVSGGGLHADGLAGDDGGGGAERVFGGGGSRSELGLSAESGRILVADLPVQWPARVMGLS